MKIDVQITQGLGLGKALKNMGEEVKKELRKAIIATALDTHKTAVKEIQQGKKSGRRYIKKVSKKTGLPYRVYIDDLETPPTGRILISSAVGEAPASDTGTLANSIRPLAKQGLNAEVQANAIYSGYLEDDLQRPFLGPALDKNFPILEKRVDDILNKAINEV